MKHVDLEGLTYGDVLIIPNYSDIPTREDIDIRTEYLGRKRVPIMSAPMDTVSGPAMVEALYRANAYGVLHRFGNDIEEDVIDILKENIATEIGISIGVKDWEKTKRLLDRLIPAYKIHSITIDVAHGYHALVGETITNIKENYEDIYVIAGNVATGDGFKQLADWGADAVRVGIGPGSACTTRETTGVGVPQLSALRWIGFAKLDWGYDTTIIADGGIQNPGDIAKALAMGADVVMLGRLLAGADEAPGKVRGHMKSYSGQSTKGSNGLRGAPEGVEGWVERTGPVAKTIETFTHYLRSSFSYVGARNIEEFRDRVTFLKVSPATHLESGVRI